MQNNSIELKELIDIIKRKWAVIIGIIAIFFIISVVLNFFVMKPEYKANIELTVGNTKKVKDTKINTEMYQNIIDTYLKKDNKELLINNAIQNSKLNVNANTIIEGLKITPKVYSSVFEVGYLDRDKEQATSVVEGVVASMINTATEKNPDINIPFTEKLTCTKKPVIHKKILNVGIFTILGILFGLGIGILSGLKENSVNIEKHKK
ncbi:Wzz/FepE/Etk N-terminal domain-containing protein [Clostridium thermobutyricum]|uniref:Wzz/FepE/Etk N-terminal domain-containing protein n=1 Tax=Clostridium thermobutyricum TaxID=29372 RepID=UPI0029429D92|nr:Wzz/FepE/Etk N-terminal domain-containing protein [Clostridium thermobutyricum]